MRIFISRILVLTMFYLLEKNREKTAGMIDNLQCASPHFAKDSPAREAVEGICDVGASKNAETAFSTPRLPSQMPSTASLAGRLPLFFDKF